MADEQYRWLDRDAAERLLRGEPLETVDADTREQADRLAGALRALSSAPPLSSAELPGEAAALAAFRAARTGADDEAALPAGERRGRTADAGLVRLGRVASAGRRSSRVRPARLGLAAVLAAGMIGGVAMAAQNGVLPTPFGGHEPAPAASVSAGATPRQPLLSPSPGATGGRGPDAPSPDGSTQGASGGSRHDDAGGGAASGQPDPDEKGTSGRSDDKRGGLLASCRDLRQGKQLTPDRRRALEGAAQGSGRVKKYCDGVLGDADGRSGTGRGSGQENGGKGDNTDKGDKDDKGDKGGKGAKGGDDDGHHIAPGGNHHRENGESGYPTSAAFAPPVAGPEPVKPVRSGPSPAASPAPVYSALPVPAPS
ncbi:extensin [Streptomyces sp. NPDC004082]|uniref:extensin n=1 Tax=unclassified Streptomyces TaxID=2593676 RepID=UPI0033B1F7EF